MPGAAPEKTAAPATVPAAFLIKLRRVLPFVFALLLIDIVRLPSLVLTTNTLQSYWTRLGYAGRALGGVYPGRLLVLETVPFLPAH
mgnify:CR=1 FL=1